MNERSRQPRWRRYLWLLGSVILLVNGSVQLFADTDEGGLGWYDVTLGIVCYALAALWLRKFLTGVNSASREERVS